MHICIYEYACTHIHIHSFHVMQKYLYTWQNYKLSYFSNITYTYMYICHCYMGTRAAAFLVWGPGSGGILTPCWGQPRPNSACKKPCAPHHGLRGLCAGFCASVLRVSVCLLGMSALCLGCLVSVAGIWASPALVSRTCDAAHSYKSLGSTNHHFRHSPPHQVHFGSCRPRHPHALLLFERSLPRLQTLVAICKKLWPDEHGCQTAFCVLRSAWAAFCETRPVEPPVKTCGASMDGKRK